MRTQALTLLLLSSLILWSQLAWASADCPKDIDGDGAITYTDALTVYNMHLACQHYSECSMIFDPASPYFGPYHELLAPYDLDNTETINLEDALVVYKAYLAGEICSSICPQTDVLSPLGVGAFQATLLWSTVPAAVSYDVRHREAGSTTWITKTVDQTNLLVISQLMEQTDYEYQVATNCADSASNFTESEYFTTTADFCVPPENFTLDAVTETTAQFSWDLVDYALLYTIRYRELGTQNWTSKTFYMETSTTRTDLFPNTVYEAQIGISCGDEGNYYTVYSEPIEFQTDQIEFCAIPQNLHVTTLAENFAIQNWSSVTGAVSYTLRRQVLGTSEWIYEDSIQDTNLATWDLEPATTYVFQVQAHCLIGDSPYSPPARFKTTPATECLIPVNLDTIHITHHSAGLVCDYVQGVTLYVFRYRQEGESAWNTTSDFSGWASLNSLAADTNYEWQVRANCGYYASSEYSDTATFKTLEFDSCPTPWGLNVLGINYTQATLIWVNESSAIYYDLRYRVVGTATWAEVQGVQTNLKVVYGLSPSTEYEFQVKAYCQGESTEYSASDTFSTL